MTDCVIVRRRPFRSEKKSEPAAARVTLLGDVNPREADGLIRKEPGAGPQHIKTLFVLGAVGGLTDGELLILFNARGGEPAEMAFSALVERHGPMVLRVCRSILRDEHDAEDAFQATFRDPLPQRRCDSKARIGRELASWGRSAGRRLRPSLGGKAKSAREAKGWRIADWLHGRS